MLDAAQVRLGQYILVISSLLVLDSNLAIKDLTENQHVEQDPPLHSHMIFIAQLHLEGLC